MFDFEMTVKQANERHEEMVRELMLERQLPRKTQANLFANAINAAKAVFAPKAAAPAQPAPKHNARRSLATK